jgi:hypothetical protein
MQGQRKKGKAKVEADQSLITTVAETTGRVAAKVTNVIGSLTGALNPRRKKQG